MSEEEKKAIKWFDTERKLVEITNGDNNYFSIILNLIDKLKKENEDMREELQMYVDTPINKLIVENEELKEDNKKLCVEISDLKEINRIDKAIEYIENKKANETEYSTGYGYINNIEKILKGE